MSSSGKKGACQRGGHQPRVTSPREERFGSARLAGWELIQGLGGEAEARPLVASEAELPFSASSEGGLEHQRHTLPLPPLNPGGRKEGAEVLNQTPLESQRSELSAWEVAIYGHRAFSFFRANAMLGSTYFTSHQRLVATGMPIFHSLSSEDKVD